MCEENRGLIGLPMIVKMKIRQHLDFKTLCALVLVCRDLRIEWEDPLLWRKLKLRPKNLKYLPNILASRRFSKLRFFSLAGIFNCYSPDCQHRMILDDSCMSALRDHSCFKNIDLGTYDKHLHEDFAISYIFERIDEIDELVEQIEEKPKFQTVCGLERDAFFQKIASSGVMKVLNCSHNPLFMVNPVLLAVSINTLEEAYLVNCFLTAEQILKLLEQALVVTKLKVLDLRFNIDLTEIDNIKDLLSKARQRFVVFDNLYRLENCRF